MQMRLNVVAAIAACVLSSPLAHSTALTEAQQAAKQGRAGEALRMLAEVTKTSPGDDAAFALRCTVETTLDHYDAAISACETAVRLKPENSDYQLNLAHAYGAKAAHAGTFYGMRTVGKIRGAFEKAAQLDPNSVNALSDLGEFYVEAPGIVGGGTDKARAVAAKLIKISPARGHRLLGMIAAKDGSQSAAESEYKQALNIAHSPEAYVDLARFAMKQKNWDLAATYAVDAIHHDKKHAGDSIDAANLLVQMKRNLDVAQAAYRAYFSSPAMDAGVPVFYVHTLLAESLKSAGDADAAKAEFAEALKLAPNYERAKRGVA